MKSRIVRVGVLAVGLLALLGVMTPPAHADLIFGIAFVGTATLTGPGLGYPCTDDVQPTTGTTTFGLNPLYLCVPTVNTGVPLVTTLPPLPGDPVSHPENLIPNGHVHFNHNPHTFGFQSTASLCVGGGVSPLKLHTADLGGCSIQANGTVDGHCGLSGGEATGSATVTNLTGSLDQTFIFNLHFNGITGVLLLTGHVTNLNTGQNGKLFAVVLAVPPNTVLTPPQSCLNLSAVSFQIVGTAAGFTTTL